MNFLSVSLKNFLLAGLLLFIAGCSSRAPNVVDLNKPVDSNNNVSTLLEAHLEEWVGTPYKLGGVSPQGIDCSGFVVRTYKDLFGVNLPRTAKEQANAGQIVGRSSMRPGDLVVFKTGFTDHHVGIYVGGNEFIHASSSVGVTKSRLDNPYWAKRPLKVVRPVAL